MKLNVKYMIAAFALLGLVGCDKNFEEFETSGGGSPAAVELSTVVSEALPGQIKLTWKAPEGDYAYMQIRYYDPLQKKNICKIASKGTTEMLIENTRARFGDWSVSSDHAGASAAVYRPYLLYDDYAGNGRNPEYYL